MSLVARWLVIILCRPSRPLTVLSLLTILKRAQSHRGLWWHGFYWLRWNRAYRAVGFPGGLVKKEKAKRPSEDGLYVRRGTFVSWVFSFISGSFLSANINIKILVHHTKKILNQILYHTKWYSLTFHSYSLFIFILPTLPNI